MLQIRWPEMKYDDALTKDVASVRPNKPSDWEGIAGVLSAAFPTDDKPVALKGRGCRECLDRLRQVLIRRSQVRKVGFSGSSV